MKTTQPHQINLMVYPQGDARPVIDFDRLVQMIGTEKLVYLNAQVADRMMSILQQTLKDETG